MNQQFVKMMNRIAEVENDVLKGLVLDGRGKWISISEKIAIEQEFLSHLEAGQVFFEGRWVAIEEAKEALKRALNQEAAQAADQPPPVLQTPPETAEIIQDREGSSSQQANKNRVTPPREGDDAIVPEAAVALPPETQSIIVDSGASSQAPGASDQQSTPPDPVDDFPEETKNISITPGIIQGQKYFPEQVGSNETDNFAPETACLVFESGSPLQGAAEAVAVTGNHQEVMSYVPEVEKETSAFEALSSSEWEKSRKKHNRIVLMVGSIIVIVTGLSVLGIILFQVFH